MRIETRYIGPWADAETIRTLAGLGANCLQYGVTNHYLDVADGSFAQAVMGSPRLRLRLYESAGLRFGQLEHKRQVSDRGTEKTVWPAEQVWSMVVSAMPWLADIALALPPRGHELAILTSPYAAALPGLGTLRYVSSLRYRRVSCQGRGLRVTADLGFSPAVVGPEEMILETKGERALDEARLRELGLRPLTLSKFALLGRVAA